MSWGEGDEKETTKAEKCGRKWKSKEQINANERGEDGTSVSDPNPYPDPD